MDGRFVMILFLGLMMGYVVWNASNNQDNMISTSSNDTKHGQELFETKCADCHVLKEGIPLKGPVLGFYGQEYRLTDRELVATAKQQGEHNTSLKERNDLSDAERKELTALRETMRKTTEKLSSQDVRDIIAFLKTSWTSDARLEHWIATHQPPGQ